MAKLKSVYVCSECGYESAKWYGKCPGCGEWNTMNEETPIAAKSAVSGKSNSYKSQAVLHLNEINGDVEKRISTGVKEFDRVLGGGIVEGSLVLLSGDPGIGKSTILLQICQHLGQSKSVLYVSGEESANQIKLRAVRLGVTTENLGILAQTDVGTIAETIRSEKPDVVIIDSIQTMVSDECASSAGSITQVRECTNIFMHLAKSFGIPIFIVGHVNKDGGIAGPKVLEHIVDTVLYFEGERQHTFRILRAVKNRFGSTNEIGIFEMQSGGLVEVLNPSQVFLEERLDGATGSSIVVTMEGTRPILAEVQALVTPTMFGNAKRTTTGLDFNRASLIMAVLEKRAGLLLQNQDAYLKSAGGVKLDEPAIDLAVAVAIASSYKDLPTNPQECFIGEIGLTGEIRRVNRIEQRINEAAKLGFTKVYAPKNSLNGLNIPETIEVIGVTTIGEVLKKVFG